MALHRIQQFILAQLSESDSLRYRDMKPSSMEASQFMYHLRSLMSVDLVQKSSSGSYSLSPAGRLYLDRADKESMDIMNQPRMGALIVCRHPQKGLLRIRRNLQPARGYIGFPIVDLPLGFPLPMVSFASDGFFALTGKRVKLLHRGDGYINLVDRGEFHGNVFVHVLTCDTNDETTPAPSVMYDFLWEADMSNDDQEVVLKSSPEIISRLESNEEFFYFEQTFDLN